MIVNVCILSGCDCDVRGTKTCMPTKECICRENFTGTKCDQCTAGYYNFPACIGRYSVRSFIAFTGRCSSRYCTFFAFTGFVFVLLGAIYYVHVQVHVLQDEKILHQTSADKCFKKDEYYQMKYSWNLFFICFGV